MKEFLALMCILGAAYYSHVGDEHQSVMFLILGMAFAVMVYIDRAVATIKKGQK